MLQVLSVLFCLAVAVHAAPTPLETRSVTASVLSDLNLWGQYAGAAYCVANTNSPGDKVATGPNCPLLEAATTTTIIEFENSLITDVTGFVAVDSTYHHIVVSFRGSQSVRNWLANIDFTAIPTDICPGCTVHQGFWNSWLESRARILEAVKDAVAKYPSYNIVATGHSLGGAIATLCAANLRNDGYAVTLYTYASPQVGMQTTADYINSQPGGNYRITHTDDIVPKLPGILLGFRHVGTEYWITSSNNIDVTMNDITVIPGHPLIAGNQATWTSSIEAHSWMLNKIGACSPGGFEF